MSGSPDYCEPKPVMKRAIDYNTSELRAFREKFIPLAEHYRGQQRRMTLAIGGYLVFVALLWMNVPLPNYVAAILWLGGGILIFRFLGPQLPDCPACGNCFSHPLGAYCPDCGGPLVASDTLRRTRCVSCEKNLRGGKSRNYRCRGCTHCGVPLDDLGL